MFQSTYGALDYSRQLRRAIRRFAPDLVHSNGLKMNLLGVWAKDSSLPMIWHLHDYVSSRPWVRKAMRFCRSRCSAMLANSNSVRDDLRSSLKRPPYIHTLYNAVDVNEFSPQGPELDLDALCGLEPPALPVLRVGLIATMAWWKGHRDFIRALALLDETSHIRGYIVGGPVYQSEGSQVSLNELKALATTLGIQHRLGFTGFVERPSAAMRGLDVVVHASTCPEPFGRVIIEAMACAKPVLTTATGGAQELVQIGCNALDFRMGDPPHLAERIRQLALNPELRRQLGAAGRETTLKNFDRERLGGQLASFYRQVLTQSNQ